MIADVDESLRALIRRDALEGTDVEVVLDAPTKEWSARRNQPTLDLYLYDIREDLRRRTDGMVDVYDDDGKITKRAKPPRWYKLSYLITAWTQRPEDEHRLLAAVLACLLKADSVPSDVLAGQLSGLPVSIPLTVALPPPEDRALSDVWSALGGELKPSLDLVVIAPFDVDRFAPVGPEVREGLRLRVGEQAPTHELSEEDELAREAVARRVARERKRRRRVGDRQLGRGSRQLGRGTLPAERFETGGQVKPGRTFEIHDLTHPPEAGDTGQAGEVAE